jgi:phosphopantothenoylcysteine decarboxylase / phosphopantothenate---cysteine ligase
MLKGKKIVLGITGSIAAYKSCLIIRGLIKRGAEVQVVITPAGKEFITPITLSALTHKPVVSEFFSQRDGTWNSHVDLGLWADAMVIAPCTASTMGKMAHGIADNMLITTYLSMKAPVFIAPAMDLDMYKHPSTQANMKTLLSYGNHIIEPEVGFLASGLEGKGRMEEPDVIVDYLDRYFQMKEDEANAEAEGKTEEKTKASAEGKAEEDSDALLDLSGKKVMITAGPTYEKIDPVRFIGNYSSGKMGFALAEECLRRGADVTLIAGPVALSCSPAIHRINVESCEEMYQAATQAFGQTDAAILCAAVADFKPSTVADRKIKREKDDLELTLVPTHDIAAALGGMKQKHQRIVAFALETNDEENNAQKKRVKKNADFIVLNSTRNPGTTFRTDDNQITIISEKGKKEYEKKPKTEVARDIIDELALLL